MVTVEFDLLVGDRGGDESRRVTLDRHLNHGGIGISESVGHSARNSTRFGKLSNGCLLPKLALPLVGKSIPIGIILRAVH